MNNFMKEKFGIVKIIFIDSMKFDYVIINTSDNLHLFALNGAGKTSIIKALQFLYIDNLNDMDFGEHTPDETLNYYFKSSYSYIVIECYTPKYGHICFVYNSEHSRSTREKFSKTLILAPFNEKYFINKEGDIFKPNKLEKIKEYYSESGNKYYPVSIGALKYVICDITAPEKFKELPSLLLLPSIKNEKNYLLFKKYYINILSLKHMSMLDFQKLLSEIAESNGKITILDLQNNQADLNQLREEIKWHNYIEKHQNIISELYDIKKEQERIYFKVPKNKNALKDIYENNNKQIMLHMEKTSTKLQKYEDLLEKMQTKYNLEELTKKFHWKEKDILDLSKKINNHRSDVEKNIFGLENFDSIRKNYDLLVQRHVELKQNKNKKEELKEEYKILYRDYIQKRKQLEKEGATLINTLVNKIGVSEKQINLLRKIFLPDLIVSKDYKITNPDNLKMMLDKITKAYDENNDTIEILGIKILLSNNFITDHNQVDNIIDTEQFKKDIEKKEVYLKELDNKISSIENGNALNELTDIEKSLPEKREMLQVLNAIREYARILDEEVVKLNNLKDEYENLKIKKEKTELKIKRVGNRISEIKELLSEIKKENLEYEEIKNHIGIIISFIEQENLDSTEINLPNFNEAKHFFNYIKATMENINKYNSHNILIKNKLFHMSRELGHVMDDENVFWDKLWTSYSTMDQVKKRIKNLQDSFFENIQRKIEMFLMSYQLIQDTVSKINKTLRSHEISSIEEIKINLKESETYRNLFNLLDGELLNASHINLNISTDFISNRLMQQKRINLRELFNISIWTKYSDGSIKETESFDKESNGTTITLKLLIMIELLTDLFTEYSKNRNNKTFIHYFIDEAHDVDKSNLKNIVIQNLEKGYMPITASTKPIVDPMMIGKLRILRIDAADRARGTPSRVRERIKVFDIK